MKPDSDEAAAALVAAFQSGDVAAVRRLTSESAAVLGAVAPQDMGKASGVQNTLTRFGSVFAIAVASAVFAATGHLGSAAAFTDGFAPALAVVAGLSALGGVAALLVTDRRSVAVAVIPEAAQAVA